MNESRVTTDDVLDLLRKLSPRDRLRVVLDVLPELEKDLPEDAAAPGFWQDVDILQLARQQRVEPVTDFAALLGGWPDDESIDEFMTTVRDWRRQSPAEVDV